MRSTNFICAFSSTIILFRYCTKLSCLVLVKNKISIGFSTTVFFATLMVNPFFARDEFSPEIESLFRVLNSEKSEILTPSMLGFEIRFPPQKTILYCNLKLYFLISSSEIETPFPSTEKSAATIFLREVYFQSSCFMVGNPFAKNDCNNPFFSTLKFSLSEKDFMFSIKPTFYPPVSLSNRILFLLIHEPVLSPLI